MKTFTLKTINILLIFSIFISCNKDDQNQIVNFNGSGNVSVNTSDSNNIQRQLMWIARGLTGVSYSNPDIKLEVYLQILGTEYFTKTNTELDADVLSVLAKDYDLETQMSIYSHFPLADYNHSYFFRIDIDDCEGDVVVIIPECDNVDTSKLHVVTAENPFQPFLEEFTGYFVNGNGDVDSLTIHEENMDSVYLWVVGLEQDCFDQIKYKKEGCDEDGICEPWIGETTECADCDQYASRTWDEWTLSVKSLQFSTDWSNKTGSHPGNRYQEAFIQSKYDIGFGFIMKNNQNYVYVSKIFSVYGAEGWGADIVIGKCPAAKKDGIKRCKVKNSGGQKCNRGKDPFDHDTDLMLDHQFDAANDTFIFVIYEMDQGTGQNGTAPTNLLHGQPVTVATNGHAWSYAENQNVGNTGTGDEFVIVEPTNASFLFYPAQVGIWTLTGVEEYETEFTLDGELKIILALTKD